MVVAVRVSLPTNQGVLVELEAVVQEEQVAHPLMQLERVPTELSISVEVAVAQVVLLLGQEQFIPYLVEATAALA